MKLDINPITGWIHRNAREIELARWKYHFENGEKMDVVHALLPYQNKDGGFANGLDSDNWNTNSLPYATLLAMDILKEIHFEDVSHPIFQGIFKYLESTYPNGWLFTVPTNSDFPHASFYNYDEEYNKVENTGIIMKFSAFVLEFGKHLAIYKQVVDNLTQFTEKLFQNELGDIGPSGFISLITTMKNVGIEGYDYDVLEKRLQQLVYQSIQRDPEQWPFYGYRPSDYVKTPNSMFYEANKDILETEIKFLIDTIPKNDVWPVTWTWFENNELYPMEFAVSIHWAKSTKCIEKCLFLRNFGKLGV